MPVGCVELFCCIAIDKQNVVIDLYLKCISTEHSKEMVSNFRGWLSEWYISKVP